MNNITIVGTSHLALVVSSGFLSKGFKVNVLSDDKKHIDNLKKLKFPIFEPGVNESYKKSLKNNKLSLNYLGEKSLDNDDIIYLAEDVTKTKEGADLTNFFSLINKICKIKKTTFRLMISTQLPVGTSKKLIKKINTKRLEINKVYFAHVPEFLRLGTALDVFLSPDYLHILGCEDDETFNVCKKKFELFDGKLYRLSLEQAEMGKHIANTFTATTVTFISEIIKVAEILNIDLKPVSKVMKNDKRIGSKAYISPGLGFSGGNLTRDILAMRNILSDHGEMSPFFDTVLAVNQYHNEIILRKLDHVFTDYSNLKIGFLGITYKSLTDTLKGSLTIRIGEKLIKKGAKIFAYDPLVSTEKDFLLSGVKIVSSLNKCIDNMDCVVVMIEKQEFQSLNAKLISKTVNQKIILDAINYFNPEEFVSLGFKYSGIGTGIKF